MRSTKASEIDQHPILSEAAREEYRALRDQRTRAAASGLTRQAGSYTLLTFAEQKFEQALEEYVKARRPESVKEAAVHWIYELVKERKRSTGRPTNAVRDTLTLLTELYHSEKHA